MPIKKPAAVAAIEGPEVLTATNLQGVSMFYLECTKGRYSARADAFADASEFASSIEAGEFSLSSYKTGDGRPVFTRAIAKTGTGVFANSTLTYKKGASSLYEAEIEEVDGV